MTDPDNVREQAISIVASHSDKDALGMLAFVNGALKGVIAWSDAPAATKIVIEELQQQIDEYIENQFSSETAEKGQTHGND